MSRLMLCRSFSLVLIAGCLAAQARAEVPTASYIFPAGGQQGTTVQVRVGGHFLHEECPWEMLGQGVTTSPTLKRTSTIWFEGPVIPQPESQQKEDYPKDQAGSVAIAADAPLGTRYWRAWTSQGTTPAFKFVVGSLPEVVETETDGEPIPTAVTLPVTINGRIFPREDVDVWTFEGKAGQPVTCEAASERFGSPLQPRLEIRDSDGRRLAEDVGALGNESRVRFTPAADGTYAVRIHDVNYMGLQHYVYRLTITTGPYVDRVYPLGGRRGTPAPFTLTGQQTPAEPVAAALPAEGRFAWQQFTVNGQPTNPVLVALDDLPEVLEAEPANPVAALPVVANGRIQAAGDVDLWPLDLKKGETFEFDLQAARYGSPLDSVLSITDADGKELARSDDVGGNETDSRLTFAAPADGRFIARVEDRLASRGGPAFAYRLRIAPPSQKPGFRLKLAVDALTLDRGKTVNLKITAERLGGFNEDIVLAFENLPGDVTAGKGDVKIAKGQNEVQVPLAAAEKAVVQLAKVKVRGNSMIDGQPVAEVATVAAPFGEPELDQLQLAVSMPTPFKFHGVFEQKYAPRGAVFVRHYTIDRQGFDGPLVIGLADRQFRHLQGVTGETITVPAGVNEFDYAIYLPPYMEIGRTSRSILSATGLVTDEQGRQHKVSYSSGEPADQIILLVDPGQLSVDSRKNSLQAQPGAEVEIPVDVGRGQGLDKLPVTVELIVPEHIRGLACPPIQVPAGRISDALKLSFAPGELGPFNMPLLIRATALDKGRPVVAETKLTITPPRAAAE